MTKLCAVIIAAYRASEWIGPCLASVEAQERLPGWRYEVRIGVDACEETSRTLADRGAPHWWSHANVGPHLIRNTLMAEPADAYAVVDADDWVAPNYLRTLLPLLGRAGDRIAASWRQPVTADGEPHGNRHRYGNGTAVFSVSALRRLGGFRPWRVAADSDAIRRAQKLRIRIAVTDQTTYYRRLHPAQLTQATPTGRDSQLRKGHKRDSREMIRRGDLYVRPVRAELVWRPALTPEPV